MASPGEVVALKGVNRVHVGDVFVEVGRNGVLTLGEERFNVADLPRRWKRYELRAGPSPGTLVVDVVRPADAEFHGAIEGLCETSCSPVVPFEFEGIVLDGPRMVCCAESTGADWDSDPWVAHPVPRFVVAGAWSFSGPALASFGGDPNDVIKIVVENTATGVVTRRTIQALLNDHEYDVLGIDSSPAEPPSGEQTSYFEEDVTIGGYFNAPMGLFVGEPETAYTLRVYAEGGGFRSNVVEIEIQP